MLDLGTEGNILMEIVAFDEDDKADGTGKAGITWISKDLLATAHNMNDTATTTGGWESSGMRSYLKTTIKPLIPETVRNGIVEVSKVSSTYNKTNKTILINGQTTTDDVWIPGVREIFGTSNHESTGANYSGKFTSDSDRIKRIAGVAKRWWLRSSYGSTSFRYVVASGGMSGEVATASRLIALGFCTN